MAASALAAVPVADPGPLDTLVAVLGAAAVAVVTIGVGVGWAAFGPLAAAVLGAQFVASLYEREPVLHGSTPIMAAGLLLVAELTAWSAESRTAGAPGQPATTRAAIVIGGAAAALLVSVALVGVVSLPIGRDLSLGAVGAGAVALVAAVLVGSARRGTDLQ